MHKIWLDQTITYDGTQLLSHWIRRMTSACGDALCSFIGPADVPIEHMVDLEDVARNAPIFSKCMLHFIVEHFEGSLELAIARQRLLIAIAADALRAETGSAGVERRGDDLYDADRKLSVSIATASPVSTLIHFAINIKSEGTPVPTRGLADYGIDPRPFADKVMRRYLAEIDSMQQARVKVRAVG